MKTSTRFTLQSLVCTLVLGAFSSQCLGQYYAETDDRSSIFSWSFQFSAPPKPFSYFNADTQSASIINAYLLSYLSNRIYDDTFLGFGYNQRWEDEFAQELGLNGLELVDFITHAPTSTEVAILRKHGELIIVFRGSHPFGSGYNITGDWLADLQEEAVSKQIGGASVFVHEGFWHTSSSVYDRILQLAVDAHENGDRIWLAGHSLGGANATLTAARLHYEDHIPVSGLHTFGSPRVGDASFQKLLDRPGAGAGELANVTQRWVMDGDYATTIFDHGSALVWRYNPWWRCYYPRWISVRYFHVGQTNTIQALSNGFQFLYNTGENRNMEASPLSLLGEHGMYVPALKYELTRLLTADGSTMALESLSSLP